MYSEHTEDPKGFLVVRRGVNEAAVQGFMWLSRKNLCPDPALGETGVVGGCHFEVPTQKFGCWA